MVAPIGMKFCMMIHIGPEQNLPPYWGGTPGVPQIPNFGPKFWPFDREYLANSKSQLHVSLSLASARRQLTENGSHGAIPPRGVYPRMAGLCLADALVLVFPLRHLISKNFHKDRIR